MRPPVVTALYVPGDRPDRFEKAVASGAQLVILDLEDAVAPERKALARDAVVGWLHTRAAEQPLIDVRVNAGSGDDVAALAGIDAPFTVRVPKVESLIDISPIVASLGSDVAITAMIETARGVEAIAEIAAHPAVTSLGLGEADLASDLRSVDQSVLDWARIRLLVAARAAGKPAPMMSVYPDIKDVEGLHADTLRGKAMGFVGRTAIHPVQVPVIAAAFAPTDAELAWAREVLAATKTGGVSTLASGEMVDPAMRGRAQSTLALHAATAPG